MVLWNAEVMAAAGPLPRDALRCSAGVMVCCSCADASPIDLPRNVIVDHCELSDLYKKNTLTCQVFSDLSAIIDIRKVVVTSTSGGHISHLKAHELSVYAMY